MLHSCANIQGSHCQGMGWKEVGAASYRTMNAVLLLWVTTDKEMAATCGHLMQRHSPNHGGAVRKLLFNDGRLRH